ncbi:MAG: ADOP family duplicated permease [Gemmatimonadales bacterium]
MTRPDRRSRFGRLFGLALRRPDDAGPDADAELASMMDEQVRHLIERGMDPEAARAEALRRFGTSVPQTREAVQRSAARRDRGIRLREWIDDAVVDIAVSLRSFRKSPGLAAAAVLTLALAIGANTAIFSAVEAVLLRPLPFAHPRELVALWEKNPDFGWDRADAAPANMLDWKKQAEGFADIGGYSSFGDDATLTGKEPPRLLSSRQATGNFFSLLGVRPALGRLFRDEETWRDGDARVVVLTQATWRDAFGADPAVIGTTIELDGRPTEVIGVLPKSFALPGLEVDLWYPTRWDRAFETEVWFRRAHWLRVVGRLKPGMTPERADATLQTVVARLQRDFPVTNARMGAGLTPLHEFLVGSTRLPLLVIFGGVSSLLLIACGNIANLLLVRSVGQARESAVRLALGAGRGRLLRQALTESALLAAAGGIAGIALGAAGASLLAALRPAGLLPTEDITMSWVVLGYSAAASALAAVLFGLAPASVAARRRPAEVLRAEGRGASGSRRATRWADLLLVGQVAVTIALTLGAGLLVRSYLRLSNVDPGFDSRQVLTVSLDLPGIRFDSAAKVFAFYAELERRTRALAGVESAAIVSKVPLGPPSWSSDFAIQGQPPRERAAQVVHREQTHDYQRVMRVPLRRGRLLTEADRRGAPGVVLINETMARMHFAGLDPIGQRLAFDRIPDSTTYWRTIVGVVGDERQVALGTESTPEIIAPYEQEPRSAMTLVVRTTAPPRVLAAPIRAIVADLDPMLAISSIRTMDEIRAISLGRERFLTGLLLSFAGVGLGLSLVGVYGVGSELARRRLREMGIRLAIGATPGGVRWLIVRHGLGLTTLGALLGVTAALAAAGLIRSLLYQVAPSDPVTFVVVPALVLVTAAAASWLPGHRASRTDPAQVLRQD